MHRISPRSAASIISLCIFLLSFTSHSFSETFTNPICNGADPWVVQKDGFYYYCYSLGDGVGVTKSATLEGIGSGTGARVWTTTAGSDHSSDIWAPELHFVNGGWYIYVAADSGGNSFHRMFVLAADGSDPQGSYTFKGKIAPHTDRWAIDGTVLQMPGGDNFFVWSGWDSFNDGTQSLFCSKMLNPWTIDTGTLITRIEAENCVLTNASARDCANASGAKCVGYIDYADSRASFTVQCPAAGRYLLKAVFGNGTAGWSYHAVSANDQSAGTLAYPTTGWENWQASTVLLDLDEGENVISVSKGDGYAELDYFALYSGSIDRVCISRPQENWERLAMPINEGPEPLIQNGTVSIVYSASGSWTNDYCLGRITLSGSDPLDSTAWVKSNAAVFSRTADVFGPGHASFVKSPDLSEDWIVYHAAKSDGSGWDRNVRIQPFGWFADDTPDFGTPVSPGISLEAPSNQPSTLSRALSPHRASSLPRSLMLTDRNHPALLQGIPSLVDLRGRTLTLTPAFKTPAPGLYPLPPAH